MQQRPFRQIDVFSHHPGFGNPVAVVLDAQGLSDADMRRFAACTNLSETTFLMPPTAAGHAAGADYRLRIFSPRGELPFASHPRWAPAAPGCSKATRRACPAWWCKSLRRAWCKSNTRATPWPLLHRHCNAASPARPWCRWWPALGLRPTKFKAAQLLDNGPVWLGLLLDSADTVLGLTPDHARLKDLGQDVGVIHIAPTRVPTPNAPALWCASRRPHGQPGRPGDWQPQRQPGAVADCRRPGPTRYLVAQGECLGRAGRVYIRQDAQGRSGWAATP